MNGPFFTFLWRTLITAGISALGYVSVQVWNLGVQLRDDSIAHTYALARIEQGLPQIWARLDDHERRLQLQEIRRSLLERADPR